MTNVMTVQIDHDIIAGFLVADGANLLNCLNVVVSNYIEEELTDLVQEFGQAASGTHAEDRIVTFLRDLANSLEAANAA